MRKKLLALLSLMALLVAVFPAALAIPPASEPLTEGVDVSVWQGEIDFTQLRDYVQVVYIRSGYGLREDVRFRENARGAQENGLRFGFYHFLTAETEEEAVEQARFFARLIDRYDYHCRPVMDYEAFRSLPREQVNRVALAFLEEVERLTGHRPMVYSDAYNASFRFDAAVARYPLWVADYGPAEPDVRANWRVWTGFQYTDRGRVPGIRGDVDRDLFTPGVLLDDAPQRTYTVVRGDTLWAISRRFCTTVDELVRLNHIENPDLIFPGQVLLLP